MPQWDTWLSAVLNYSKIFEKIKGIGTRMKKSSRRNWSFTNSKLQNILGKNPGFYAEISIWDILLHKIPKNNLEIEY
jgi:hypothetical protein